MASNINYSLIKMKFPEILQKLHNVAFENAKRKNNNYTIENTILVAELKQGNLSPHIIVRKNNNEDVSDTEKKDILEFIKEYVKYFIGEVPNSFLKSLYKYLGEMCNASAMSSSLIS